MFREYTKPIFFLFPERNSTLSIPTRCFGGFSIFSARKRDPPILRKSRLCSADDKCAIYRLCRSSQRQNAYYRRRCDDIYDLNCWHLIRVRGMISLHVRVDLKILRFASRDLEGCSENSAMISVKRLDITNLQAILVVKSKTSEGPVCAKAEALHCYLFYNDILTSSS